MSTTDPEGSGGYGTGTGGGGQAAGGPAGGSMGGGTPGGGTGGGGSTGGGSTGGGQGMGDAAREATREMAGGMTAGSMGGLARIPVPGNAEFGALVLLEAFLALLLLDDRWNVENWAFATIVLGAAYLLSRGIAKASRVLEH